jgi:hypothetical protein
VQPLLERKINTYAECVFVVLVIQHAMRLRRIKLSAEVCPALQYLSTSSHTRNDFRKKEILTIRCVF